MVNKKAMKNLAVNTIRTLCMDAVEAAQSGHPGTPLALAPVAYELWQNHLNYNPNNPIWANRDRFVLSNGHASMLLYSLLYLTKVKAVNKRYEQVAKAAVSLDDIKNFRQLNSKCPGHPEYRWTSGVETTTGPLGQGVSNAVGMAIAGRWLAQKFNRPKFKLFDYNIYALCGDGCLMEGVSCEAASLAGHLKLDNLCWIYDNNHITIEGRTDLTFSENVKGRFKSYGWHTIHVDDANDLQQLSAAYKGFKNTKNKPTLIIVDSHIGYGAPNKQDSCDAHGAPLGTEEVKLTKKFYGWPEKRQFYIPTGVMKHFADGFAQRGKEANNLWNRQLADYEKKYPDLVKELHAMQHRDLPKGWSKNMPKFAADAKGLATRASSSQVLNAIAKNMPWLSGGSADLAPSTKTLLTFAEAGSLQHDNPGGRNMHFGLREHAMGAILNGMALSKIRVYGSTFLTFSDYLKPSIRLSALMELPIIYIFTHDSIGVGEDGPTHQPVEHLVSLRAIPGLIVIRPSDANEVVESWRIIMKLKHAPSALILTRQNLPTIDRAEFASAKGVHKGAYILAENKKGQKLQLILIATGSEVPLVLEAYKKLTNLNIATRVVSMPSWEIFDMQTKGYKESVLPSSVKARIAVEKSSSLAWERYVGNDGIIIGMHSFGASAPLKKLQQKFGFTANNIVNKSLGLLGKKPKRR